MKDIIKPPKSDDIKTKILSSTRILSVINSEAKKNMYKKATNLEDERKLLVK